MNKFTFNTIIINTICNQRNARMNLIELIICITLVSKQEIGIFTIKL